MNFTLVERDSFWNYRSMIIALSSFPVTTSTPAYSEVRTIATPQWDQTVLSASTTRAVPFYSQFKDIRSPKWQKVGCGVTSLAMIIDYYKPGTVSVNTLLTQGISAGAYLNSAGWTYKGLIGLAKRYGLEGSSYDLASLSSKNAFSALKGYLADGPVMASVHYGFDPKSTIPHLVVLNRIENDTIYYNDPAAKSGEKTISSTDFLKAWKKRFIVIKPPSAPQNLSLSIRA